MPLDFGSNPQGVMAQQAPMMQPGAPPGAGLMASPQAGLPSMPPGDPATAMMLGQLAAKLLQKQQGVKYTQQLLRHLKTIMQKVLASSMLENPAAESDIASIIQKLGAAGEKLGKSGPSQSPQLTTTLADIVGRGGGGMGSGINSGAVG